MNSAAVSVFIMSVLCQRFFQRKFQADLEKIAVKVKIKASTLKLCQAFGDRKPQPAAFGISGNIASDKAFCQFFSRYVQGLCRDVFQREVYPTHLKVYSTRFARMYTLQN